MPRPAPASRPDALPPSLPAHPLVQTWWYMTDPIRLLDRCSATFGDLFTLRLAGTGNWVVLSAPADLKAMFTAPPDLLHAGEANASVFGPIAGSSTVFTMEEDPHLRRRKLLLPPLHGDRMQVYLEVMREITDRAVASWPVGRPFAIHPEMQRITLLVILRVIFGLERGRDDERLIRILMDLANTCVGSSLLLAPALQWDLGRFSPWGRILRILREADAAIYAEIARRRAASGADGRDDILSLLLEVRDEEGRGLSDRELRDELVTMLMAGHETTGTALAWAFERILSLPEVHETIEAELRAALSGGRPEREHLPRLEYLDAVIKETHRARPITPIGGSRVAKAAFEIRGYTIPPGTTLTNCMYLLHRRPDLYPDPERFLPERFIGRKVDPYEWTPFGGGVRRCLGMAFALFEMKVVLATALASARLRIVRPHAKVRRRGFFLVPEGGPQVVLEERREWNGR